MTARHKLADVIVQVLDCDRMWPDAQETALAVADAVIGMVRPLEWEDMGHYHRAKTNLGEYEAGWDDGAWASCDGPSMWEWSRGEDHRGLTLYQAQEAANTHHLTQWLSMIGLHTGEGQL